MILIDKGRNNRRLGLVATSIVSVVLFGGCGPDQRILDSGKEKPEQGQTTPQATTFESDMAAMRAAGFSFVHVLRRKDGGKLDTEDRSILRTNTADTNRRVVSDDDRAVIIGTNYKIPPENMKVLRDRFNVEDVVLPPETSNTNTPI